MFLFESDMLWVEGFVNGGACQSREIVNSVV